MLFSSSSSSSSTGPHRPRRRVRTLLPLLAVLLAFATSTALAAPLAPLFSRPIEKLPSYDGQTTCSPTEKPGTVALKALVLAAYPGTGNSGIVRDCAVGGQSEHKEGRAWDWRVNRFDAKQDAAARDLLAWLLADDQYGNTAAMARRLGIMYLIYDRQIWTSSRASDGWRTYTGASPHTDHVHISLSWDGAMKRTSYWTGAPLVADPSSLPAASCAAAPVVSEVALELPAAGFVGVTPKRILDTRTGLGAGGRTCRVDAGRDLSLTVAGKAGVPSDGSAVAVVLNLTGVASDTGTWLSAFPGSSPWAGTSSVNPARGDGATAALVTVPIGSDGTVRVRSGLGRVDVLADVVGYFTETGGAGFHSATPVRLLDTRESQAVSAGSIRKLTIADRGGLPRTGVEAVAMNVTVVGTGKPGYVSVSPDFTATPTTSSVNHDAGRPVANRVFSDVAPDGTVEIFSAAKAHVVVDVVGWFGTLGDDEGAAYHAVTPRRVVDTRNGTGTTVSSVGRSPVDIPVLNSAGMAVEPREVEALMMTLTSVEATVDGYLAAWPAGAPWPGTSDLISRPDAAVANLVPLGLGKNGAVTLQQDPGPSELVVDLLGWFGG